MTVATKSSDEIRIDLALLDSDEAQEALRAEVSNSRRSRLPVGVLLLSMHVPRSLQEDPDLYAEITQQVADRLVTSVRATDSKGQVAADAFVLVLPGLGTSSDVLIVAEGVMKVMDRPFISNGAQVYIGCSAGVAVLGTHSSTAKGLWQKAAGALLKARALGPGSCEQAQPITGAQVITHLRTVASRRPRSARVSDTSQWSGSRNQERYTG